MAAATTTTRRNASTAVRIRPRIETARRPALTSGTHSPPDVDWSEVAGFSLRPLIASGSP